jgi:tRNA pseudouridine32 synthase/23S rRNA pseudouridine746 synthase
MRRKYFFVRKLSLLDLGKREGGLTPVPLLARFIKGLREDEVLDAIGKGAFWHLAAGEKGNTLKREKNPNVILGAGDRIEFYFDSAVLCGKAPDPEEKHHSKHYGIWYKPPGLLTQGTKFGDHLSLLSFAEKKHGSAFPVHRLDRETAGLVLVAYDSASAAAFSEMLQCHAIRKTYMADVMGNPVPTLGSEGVINTPLDDKPAETRFNVLDALPGQTRLRLEIVTGREHQIRRHLDGVGHPVIGDPLYGKGNKNRIGLRLIADSIAFQDPWTKTEVSVVLDGGGFLDNPMKPL